MCVASVSHYSIKQLVSHINPLLVIRDFPRTLSSTEPDEIAQISLRAISNCTNLQSCTWTRDGTLSTEILTALSQAEHLTELEINGRNEGCYDQRVLRSFTRLHKMTLIMPSSSMAAMMPHWTANGFSSLRHLTLICRVRLYCFRRRASLIHHSRPMRSRIKLLRIYHLT